MSEGDFIRQRGYRKPAGVGRIVGRFNLRHRITGAVPPGAVYDANGAPTRVSIWVAVCADLDQPIRGKPVSSKSSRQAATGRSSSGSTKPPGIAQPHGGFARRMRST
jgi:hypothetical protein